MAFVFFTAFFLFTLSLVFFSCATTSVKQVNSNADSLSLIFAGDIMAHKNNYRTGNFDKIWSGIGTLAQDADFAFANIESPVADSIDWDTYPTFNMKSEYPQAAIDVGFNVFSLANNHTNDKGSDGITETLLWAETTSTNSQNTNRQIYFSGIHEKDKSEFDFTILEKGKWKILFVAITELLNTNAHTEYINFLSPTKEERQLFCQKLSKWKEEYQCNFCVVSVHSNEAEYIRDVTNARKNFYYSLLDAGADVVWANHPHVIKVREKVGAVSEKPADTENGENVFRKLIMYANGNTISGQRKAPNFSDAKDFWEWTGDGVLVSATFEMTENKRIKKRDIKILNTKPHFITSYINAENQIIIKKLDDDFLEELENEKRTTWKKYASERKKIVEETKEILTWR